MLLAYAAMEVSMNEHVKDIPENGEIEVAIFKNGRSRAVRIPKEIEFDGTKAILVKQPDGSIMMRTAVTAGLIDYLQRAEPWEGADFAADNDDLAELPEIDL
jgi:antitoxin VapB